MPAAADEGVGKEACTVSREKSIRHPQPEKRRKGLMMTSTPQESAKGSHLEEGEIIKILDKWAQEPEGFEGRIWSKVEMQIIAWGAIVVTKSATLADQFRCIVDSHGLHDVLQTLSTCCRARANELHGDLYWTKAALLIERALPVSTKLSRP